MTPSIRMNKRGVIAMFIRYTMVGASNTLLCLSLMYIGALLGFNYLLYTALGYLVSIFFSFFMNLYFTFRVKGRVLRRLTQFLMFSVVNVGLVECIEYTLIEYFSMQQRFAVLWGMSWYMMTGFLINRYIIYSRSSL